MITSYQRSCEVNFCVLSKTFQVPFLCIYGATHFQIWQNTIYLTYKSNESIFNKGDVMILISDFRTSTLSISNKHNNQNP